MVANVPSAEVSLNAFLIDKCPIIFLDNRCGKLTVTANRSLGSKCKVHEVPGENTLRTRVTKICQVDIQYIARKIYLNNLLDAGVYFRGCHPMNLVKIDRRWQRGVKWISKCVLFTRRAGLSEAGRRKGNGRKRVIHRLKSDKSCFALFLSWIAHFEIGYAPSKCSVEGERTRASLVENFKVMVHQGRGNLQENCVHIIWKVSKIRVHSSVK